MHHKKRMWRIYDFNYLRFVIVYIFMNVSSIGSRQTQVRRTDRRTVTVLDVAERRDYVTVMM